MNKDGTITISIFDLLGDLDDETIDRLSREVACLDTVIESVSEQILDGIDSHGYGGSTTGARATPVTSLDQARRRVARGAGEAAAREIDRLESSLRCLEGDLSVMRRVIQRMRDMGAEDLFWIVYRQEQGQIA